MDIKWTLRAKRNLDSILEHIAKDKPLAASNFVALLLKKAAILKEHPTLGRAGKLGTRELVVHQNYIVVYRVTDCVEVLRIKHAKQRI